MSLYAVYLPRLRRGVPLLDMRSTKRFKRHDDVGRNGETHQAA